jgi:hypothetical protein
MLRCRQAALRRPGATGIIGGLVFPAGGGPRQSTADAYGDNKAHGDVQAFRATRDAYSGIPSSMDGGISSAGYELEWSGERGVDADDTSFPISTVDFEEFGTTAGGTDQLITRSAGGDDQRDTGQSGGRAIG